MTIAPLDLLDKLDAAFASVEGYRGIRELDTSRPAGWPFTVDLNVERVEPRRPELPERLAKVVCDVAAALDLGPVKVILWLHEVPAP